MKYLPMLMGLIATAVLVSLSSPANAATPDEVDQSITSAIKYLYSQQNKLGNWEPLPKQAMWRGNSDLSGGQWGGSTAMATYALLAAGENPADPRLVKAIDFLEKADINGTYALAVRCQIWKYLKDPTEAQAMVAKEKKLMLNQIQTKAPSFAMFDYEPAYSGHYDHSNSQYGVLGLWAIDQMGGEIPSKTWQLIETAWIRDQMKQAAGTAGWSYMQVPNSPCSITMTTAGVATLFITQDALHGFEGADCGGNVQNAGTAAIDLGLKYMAAHFDEVYAQYPYYALYGIERVGTASGYKYFGDVNWYKVGADWLVKHQNGGMWRDTYFGDTNNTSFGLLFLVHGRAPVIVNKLNYAPPEAAGDHPAPATQSVNWDERPRDAANLAKWMGTDLERPLNWQIVTLTRPVEELHDSPILYIAGNQYLRFSDADEAKLKLFIEEGGLIFGNADCTSPTFTESFKKLGQKLTDNKYTWRILPQESVIYTAEQFPANKWRVKMQMLALSNGARELMVLASVGDPSKDWQMGQYSGRPQNHQVLADLFLYASERDHLRVKGDTYIVTPDPAITATGNIKVARLQYDGNWDPEPGGWRQLAAVMHNTQQTDLKVDPVKLGDGKLLSGGYSAAHLTGTGTFKLNDSQRDEIKKFVTGGGTLIVDACGGSNDFYEAATTELQTIFGSSASDQLTTPLASGDAFFGTGDGKIQIHYRHFAKKLGASSSPKICALRVGSRLAVFFSHEDLSVGLVGEPIDGIVGYDPQTATNLMMAMLNYSLGPNGKKPTTQATTQAASQPSP